MSEQMSYEKYKEHKAIFKKELTALIKQYVEESHRDIQQINVHTKKSGNIIVGHFYDVSVDIIVKE